MIEWRSVTKRYAGAASAAVDNFSYTVATGSFTVLLGSSGSGKSTLLSLINRMVDPTQGAVLIDGVDVAGENPVALRRRIGTVLQNGGLFPHRRVIDNVATVARLNGASKAQARTAAAEKMELVGLDASLAQRYPAQLSGGQAQRVGVARALSGGADILLMDEPFGAVDPIQRRALQHEIVDLHDRLGTTIVFVTHDVDEALLLADDIIVLEEHARIAQAGSPAELLERPANDFVRDFLGKHRSLHLEGGRVVDADGRVLGVME